MQLSDVDPVRSARFDDPSLVSAAGLVPVLALTQRALLGELTGEHLTVPGDAGCAAGAKVSALVAGMVAGTDSIDDMGLLRHGPGRRSFSCCGTRAAHGPRRRLLRQLSDLCGPHSPRALTHAT